MLTYAAHIPHSPLLFSHLHNQGENRFARTKRAVEEISDEIRALGVETVLLLTPHGRGQADSFSITTAPCYDINLKMFGDFLTAGKVPGETVLPYYLRRFLGPAHKLSAYTPQALDTASTNACLHLLQPGHTFTVTALTHDLGPATSIFEFGKAAREAVESVKKKVAVISIGDLSRTDFRLERTAARKLDLEILEQITSQDTANYLHQDPERIDSLFVCAYRPLAILLGLLDGGSGRAEILSYEQRLGIGLGTLRFT